MPANKYSDSLLMDALRGSLSNAESFGRGFGVAPVGLLGDVNALAREYITPRLPANVQGLLQSMPSAPTTESILSAIPRMTAPRMESSGMEQIGAAANPRGPINLGRAVASLPSDVARAGQEFLAAGQPARLDVYHGSPYKFEKFDASKIGTGEGAQSYGHGIYVAESPEVAKKYQYQLAPERNARDLNTKVGYIKVGDKPINPDNYDIDISQELVDAAKSGKKEFLDYVNQRRARWQELSKDESYKYRGTANDRVNEYNKLISDVKDSGVTYIGSGNIYKANLPDEMIPKMIDWDKPLSEQSKEVQNILYPYQKEIGTSFGTGEQILREIAFDRRMKGLDDSPSAVAKQLQEMGIAGVKYLDEASRSQKYSGDSAYLHAANDFKNNNYSLNDALEGMKQAYKGANEKELKDALDVAYKAPTSNFVVFPNEEQRLSILERNAEKLTPSLLYPQEQALKLAQQRAALPVEQGGLGLLAENTPEMRAQAMGFDLSNPQYHATDVDFSSIKPSLQGKLGAGVYVSPSSQYAEKYTSSNAAGNARVLPLVARGKLADDDVAMNIAESIRQEMYAQNPNFSVSEWKKRTTQALTDAGYDGRTMSGLENVITNPSNLRSRFAAFDPFRKDVATATAMGVALPDLLAAEYNQQPQSAGLLYPLP